MAERYDAVIGRIAKRHRVRRATAREWFDEMARYLELCAASATPLSPSKKVDRAWHEFLLFTREYRDFCEERFGRFVDHDPYAAPDPEAYERAYVAYTARFGTPLRRVWPDPFRRGGSSGTAGACGGDGGSGCGGGGGGGCGGGGG